MFAFVEAVIIQRALPLGDAPSGAEPGPTDEERVADQVLRLLDGSTRGDAARAGAAAELAADVALLAAFFQNIDLLPTDGGPHVDAVALLTGDALQRLAETLPQG